MSSHVPVAGLPRGAGARLYVALLSLSLSACAKDPAPAAGQTPPPADATAGSGVLTISAASRVPGVTTAVGLNYWSWTFGSTLAGSETAIGALAPAILRIGGHNNDWNSPQPFDDAQLDQAITYARAVGAEPILQVPVLDDTLGATPTAETAAAMVRYANITKAYGVKYFSIGNEPDLYADSTQTPYIPGYTAADYCNTVKAFVPAMRAVDPTIKVLGPELSWKYQSGNDWLTPILQDCGEHFDIVSVHRYPVDPASTTTAAASADAAQFRALLTALRQKMATAGQSSKPLALTETNLTWNGDPTISTLEASPGTLPAGLWVADTLGIGLTENLWTTAVWSIRESWTLGLLTPAGVKRPAYQALGLFAQHFGPTHLAITAVPAGVHAYASRNAADDRTQAVVVNWTAATQSLTVTVTGLSATPPAQTIAFAPLSMTAVEITDGGSVATWSYGADQFKNGVDPAMVK
jgi:hypothetical protein